MCLHYEYSISTVCLAVKLPKKGVLPDSPGQLGEEQAGHMCLHYEYSVSTVCLSCEAAQEGVCCLAPPGQLGDEQQVPAEEGEHGEGFQGALVEGLGEKRRSRDWM